MFDAIQTHIVKSYVNLRFGIALLAYSLPLLLVATGWLTGVDLQNSFSAYYHAGQGDTPWWHISTRDVFVGVLWAVGIFLVSYKGFSEKEDMALNAAGLLALGVALIPMEWDCGDSCSRFSLHGTCAVLFFVFIAYVCVARAKDTLKYLDEAAMRQRYQRRYNFLGAAMVTFPLVAFAIWLYVGQHTGYEFIAECLGVWVFATFWTVKSRELANSGAELRYLEDELARCRG